jgi:aldo/keto reductase family protein
MQRRHLGGLEISAVGLGCATMTPFYDEPDRDAVMETLRRAREIGVDFLDSSDAYGQGRNEQLIAHAIKGYRGKYVIASKFGNLRAPDGSPRAGARPALRPRYPSVTAARVRPGRRVDRGIALCTQTGDGSSELDTSLCEDENGEIRRSGRSGRTRWRGSRNVIAANCGRSRRESRKAFMCVIAKPVSAALALLFITAAAG